MECGWHCACHMNPGPSNERVVGWLDIKNFKSNVESIRADIHRQIYLSVHFSAGSIKCSDYHGGLPHVGYINRQLVQGGSWTNIDGRTIINQNLATIISLHLVVMCRALVCPVPSGGSQYHNWFNSCTSHFWVIGDHSRSNINDGDRVHVTHMESACSSIISWGIEGFSS